MSLDPKKLAEINKLLKSIDSIYKKIGDTNPFKNFDPTAIKDIDVELENLEKGLDKATIKFENWEDSLSGIYNSFKSIVSEISKSNTGLSLGKQSLNASAKVAAELRDHHMGISHLSVKEIQTQKEKLQTSQQNLKSAQLILQEEKEKITNGKKYNQLSFKEKKTYNEVFQQLKSINRVIEDKDGLYKDTLDKLDEAEEKEKSINKQLGVAGGLLKGISKIPILGDVFNADEALKEMDKTLRSGEGSVKALGSGFKNIGKQITGGVLNPANLLLGVITGLINGIFQSQKGIGDLAKGLGMSASSATQMRQDFASIANASGDFNVNVKGLQEAQLAVGQALGTNAQLNESDLKTLTKITKQTGLTHDNLMGIQKLSLAQGKDLDKNLKSTLGGATAYASQNKLVVDVNRTLKEVNNASSSLKLSLGGSVEELGRAVMQTQKFGITLQQAESISKGLLSFEQSISDELEAELLTGKDINFEKARQFALEGDIAKASEEVLKQLKGSEEFSKMNVIQQEAMAKAVGMTRDQLADSLIEREALQKMSAKEGETASQAYERLKASGKTEAEIVSLLGEKSAQQLEQQSAQDKFNASVEKLKEIFVQVGDNLAPIFDMLVLILEPVQMLFGWFGKIGQSIGKLIGPLGTVGKILKGLASLAIVYAAYKAYASLATIPIVGVPLGIAAAAAVTSMGFGLLGSIKDGVIDPKGGIIVSGEKGSIQLDKDDSIIAGTNLFGNDKKQQPTQSQPSPQPQQASVDMTQTNALLQQLISVIQSGGDVMLDGQKVGTALKLGTYQTQ